MAVQLQFLGTPHISSNRGSVALPAKAIGLLGYLAVTRTPQHREHLLALLWAESSDEAARKNLRNILWQIRRDLGSDAVLSHEDRVQLNPQLDVDVWAVQQLITLPPHELVAHQTRLFGYGELLAGLTLLEAPDFELWLTTERERWTMHITRLLNTLLEFHQQAGDWNNVLSVAHMLLRLDSLSEPTYQAVMEAHAQRSERSEALRFYDLLTTMLDRELGVTPLPETEALRQRIMANQLETRSAMVVPVAAVRSEPTNKPAATPFIGRQAEAAQLDQLLERSQTNGLQIVLLTGDVGIGKSRLWQEWSNRHAAERRVLTMHCLESTKNLPFAPVTDLFSHGIGLEQLRTMPSMWLTEMARLVPQLRLQLPNLPTPPALPPDEERRRLFEALTQCLNVLVGTGLIIGIDDIQWADQATSEWLDYAAHRLHTAPILIGATYRAEDASVSLQRLVANWQRDGIATKIAVERLTDAEVAQLLAHVGHTCDTRSIQTQSAGNPLYVLELSRADSANIPPMLADVIKARLAKLPAAAGQILQAAAVIDPLWHYDTLRSTAGRSEEETLDGLDALLQWGIVQERGNSYTFSHPLVATVVLQELSGARRAFLNRRAAQALERAYAGRIAPIAGRLVSHYRAANEPIQAATYADLAADHAMSLAAPAEAQAFRQQALELQPTPHRWQQLGEALEWLGDLAAARQAYETASNLYTQERNWQAVIELHNRIGRVFLAAGRPQDTIEWVNAAQNLMTTHKMDVPAMTADSLMLLGISQRQAGYPLDAAQTLIESALAIANTHHLTDQLGQGMLELGNVQAQRGDIRQAISTFEQAINVDHDSNNLFQMVLAYNNAAYNSTLINDLARAHHFVEQGIALAQTWSLRVPLQYLYSTRGEIALAEQQWSDATHWFELGLIEARSNDNAPQVANYYANLALAARGRGELEQALALLRTALSATETLTAPYLSTQINLWLAETWLQHGDHLAAHHALARARQTIGKEHGYLHQWSNAVQHQLAQHATAQAITIA